MNSDNPGHTNLGDSIEWAYSSDKNPAMTMADWLIHEINPSSKSAVEFIAHPDRTVEELTDAKEVFKGMRVEGESADDRRLAARLYTATIAAALVRHSERITTQSDEALTKALSGLAEDSDMDGRLRELASGAIGLVTDRNS